MADPMPETERRDALATLALAEPEALRAHWRAFEPKPDHTVVRGPETGLIMVRGRIGGGGAPFNVGEATATRCVVRLSTGEVGFGHVLGREAERARLVALFDALGQSPAHVARVRRDVVAPLAQARAAAVRLDAEEVAATRVDFFTMARGEDQ
jgi:alpha-D-ribose 1-methylphosphonate 5-triphosphate synthase subunit PhnG